MIPALFTHDRKLAFGLIDPDALTISPIRYIGDDALFKVKGPDSPAPSKVTPLVRNTTEPEPEDCWPEGTNLIAVGDRCLQMLKATGMLLPLLMAMASDVNGTVKSVAKIAPPTKEQFLEGIRQGSCTWDDLIRGC
jgi:hypothetical protein